MSVPTFDKTLEKTHHLLHAIEKRHQWRRDDEKALAALRAVLHTLRDRLTPEHAAGLAAQFTPLVRGIFYEGWKPAATPVKLNIDEFLAQVDKELPDNFQELPEEIVLSVMRVLSEELDAAEFHKLKHQLPEELHPLFSSIV